MYKIIVLTFFASFLVLGGCGNSGSLYLPHHQPALLDQKQRSTNTIHPRLYNQSSTPPPSSIVY